MQRQLDNVEFILTHDMLLLLIEFNESKKSLLELRHQYNLDKNDEQLLLKIKTIDKNLVTIRNEFINKFRKNNIKQIDEYLSIRNDK